jgi:hypothetical protein
LISELDQILRQLVGEHERMLKLVDAHYAAMKVLNLDAMDDAAAHQEAARLRIATLENRRRNVVGQLARLHKLDGEVTVKRLAGLYPAQGPMLLKLRSDLRAIIEHLGTRTHVAGKVAGAVLGHLNTVVRLIAGAVEQAGLYTKHGVPRVSSRIGVMEAVG